MQYSLLTEKGLTNYTFCCRIGAEIKFIIVMEVLGCVEFYKESF